MRRQASLTASNWLGAGNFADYCHDHHYSIDVSGCNMGDVGCSVLRVMNNRGTPMLITGATLMLSHQVNIDVKVHASDNQGDCSNNAPLPKQFLWNHHRGKVMSTWNGAVEISCLLIALGGMSNNVPLQVKIAIYRSRHLIAHNKGLFTDDELAMVNSDTNFKDLNPHPLTQLGREYTVPSFLKP